MKKEHRNGEGQRAVAVTVCYGAPEGMLPEGVAPVLWANAATVRAVTARSPRSAAEWEAGAFKGEL
jgi:hypothetical protein